jgi:ATPase subunit of ABC transporter with duplicated ATPase domains
VLNERNSTMIIISHDRHFLNQVCTHMADLDYGKTSRSIPAPTTTTWKPRPGARAPVERQRQGQGKDRRTAEFVRRFSANKSKAKQATSRLKLIDKIKPEDVKPSSRQYPWIRFDYDDKEKLHRLAVEVENLHFGYEGRRAGAGQVQGHHQCRRPSPSSARTASARPRCCAADGRTASPMAPSSGRRRPNPGYFAQDHSADFAEDTQR